MDRETPAPGPSNPQAGRAGALSALLAVALGLAIGWLDLQTTEVSVPILSLLLAGLLLGLVAPTAAWRSALLLALGLPAVALVGLRLGWTSAEPIRLDARIFLVALAVALAGCHAGAAILRVAGRSATSRGDT